MSIKYGVNTLGLTCPEPLLKTRVALNAVAVGECVEVLTSDASSVKDFHRLVELTAHKMIMFEQINNNNFNQKIEAIYRFVLQKGH